MLAASYFRSMSPVIFEASNGSTRDHKAVMRLRHDNVGALLGTRMKEITVSKAVYFEGQIHKESNITMRNMYSLKVNGNLSERSIYDLSDVKRYLIDGPVVPTSTIRYDHKLTSIKDGVANFWNGRIGVSVKYDVCISTIPMSSMLKIVPVDGAEINDAFSHRPIFVTRFKINVPSNVHQTIYLPEPSWNAYRATIEGEDFIIESMDSPCCMADANAICKMFGFDNGYLADESQHKQAIGKMLPIDDNVRRMVIRTLTEEDSIYSLGRFAIWLPIRIDHVVGDLDQIAKLMDVSEETRRYKQRIYAGGMR